MLHGRVKHTFGRLGLFMYESVRRNRQANTLSIVCISEGYFSSSIFYTKEDGSPPAAGFR